jgi:hypothetical protein
MPNCIVSPEDFFGGLWMPTSRVPTTRRQAQGPQRCHTSPKPCVAPIERAPLYAIKLVVGGLGTCTGIKTDASAVRSMPTARRSRASMPPATTWRASWAAIIPAAFGYIAGRHLAGRPRHLILIKPHPI